MAVLGYTTDRALRLLHPIMPFVTEELWQRLRRTGLDGTELHVDASMPESLLSAPFPTPEATNRLRDTQAEADMEVSERGALSTVAVAFLIVLSMRTDADGNSACFALGGENCC